MNRTLFVAILIAGWLAVMTGKLEARPAVTRQPAATMPDGTPFDLFTLTNSHGLRVKILPFGATIAAVEVPDRMGRLANITIGPASAEEYLTKGGVEGAIIGRYANRIGKARFTIDGVEYRLAANNGPNHIHGGLVGFHRVLWKAAVIEESDRAGVSLSYFSRDGEEGYPGNLSATVRYTLSETDELTMTYGATTDKPTHVNLTNHAYWNLSGGAAKDVLAHELTLYADQYLPTDADLIPLGDPKSVQDTPLDFRRPMTIGARIDKLPGGYDHCYVLRKQPGMQPSLAARVVEPVSGRSMEVYTTQPGVQLYTDGRNRRALCLETQHFPDSPHRPAYPSTLLRPGEEFRQVTMYKFGTVPAPTKAPFASSAAAKTPVILDTDIGDDIDDTWALAMLLKSPGLDPKLITTTCGKAEYRAKLIAKLLTVAGRTDIAVGLGEGGRDGTGGQQAWIADYRLSDYRGVVHQDGAAAIIDLINRSPQPVAVISIGPSHTLAAVLKRKPDVAGKACFIGMQGSVFKGYGGGPADAEYNVKANVAAAQTVLSAPWKQITITPLDTCGTVTLAGERFQKLVNSDDRLVKALLENYRIWANKKQVSQLTSSSVLFDTVAVYLAYRDRPLVKFQTLPISVTSDGFTKVDPKGRKMSVATDWTDRDGYCDLLVKVLTQP